MHRICVRIANRATNIINDSMHIEPIIILTVNSLLKCVSMRSGKI